MIDPQLSLPERRALLLRTLDDRAAYRDVFGYLVDQGFQSVVDCLEGLTEKALKADNPIDNATVTLPAAVAVAAVLALKGHVKRSRGKPGDSLRVHLEKKAADDLRRLHPVEDKMIVWARERKEAIRADAKANGVRIKAHDASIAAAEEAKKMFSSPLSVPNIADRMSRRSKFAPHEVAKRKRHSGKISGDKTSN